MDAAPRAFEDLETDPELGVPVPFACSGDATGTAGVASVRRVESRRVTQCALSRVCGICGSPLGRPIAFLGSQSEADRNAFHFPPCHLECAQAVLNAVHGLDVPVLGQTESVDEWVLTTTASFEFVRPGKDDVDRRPTFQPNEVLSESR